MPCKISLGVSQTKNNGEPKSKCREDQSSLDCRLVRAFVAQPIKEHTCPQSPAAETERDYENKGERTGMPTSQGQGRNKTLTLFTVSQPLVFEALNGSVSLFNWNLVLL